MQVPPASAAFDPDPDHEQALASAGRVLRPSELELAIVYSPEMVGPEGSESREAMALSWGPSQPGFREAWPALDLDDATRVNVELIPYCGARTPDWLYALPAVLAGPILFGLRVEAHQSDDPGLVFSLDPVDAEATLLRVFEPPEVSVTPVVATTYSGTLELARDQLTWRRLPSVRQIVEFLTS